MTEIKLEQGKKYNIECDNILDLYGFYKVLFITDDEKTCFVVDNNGHYFNYEINKYNWKPYQEPDIFDGIKEGDVVAIQCKGNTICFYGCVLNIDEEIIDIAMCKEYPQRAYEKIDKEFVKSITKLVPEVK